MIKHVTYTHTEDRDRGTCMSVSNWIKLERAGWKVYWGGRKYCSDPRKPDDACPDEGPNTCEGHAKVRCYEDFAPYGTDDQGVTSYGTREAEKDLTLSPYNGIEDVMLEFERVTWLDISKGPSCNEQCCNRYHTFEWTDDNDARFKSSGLKNLVWMYGVRGCSDAFKKGMMNRPISVHVSDPFDGVTF